MYDILTEPLVRVDLKSGGRECLSLPEIYERLMDGSVDSFPSLRAHQGHAWHAFLVQLGAVATQRAGAAQPPAGASEWRDALLALTGGRREPWELVVDDFTEPAFLQPPTLGMTAADDYRVRAPTPDGVDVLVNAKKHDFKSLAAYHCAPEDWVFALVSLQTCGGFSGAGNYGVSRMNGGVSSRPGVSLAPFDDVGGHVRRDLSIMLAMRDAVIRDYPMVGDGHALLWTLPWNGARDEALTLDQLDPYYIEVCRRIRLHDGKDGFIRGVRASSKAARIDSKAHAGVVGDPWAPVSRQKDGRRRALTLSEGGFTYRRVIAYLTDRAAWEPPLLLRSATGEELEGGTTLLARSLVRGQGKTSGWHERVVPLRTAALTAVVQGDARLEELGQIAAERIAQIGLVHRILSFSLQAYHCDGEPSRTSADSRSKVAPWVQRLDRMVDRRFFDDLQDEFEAAADDRADVRQRWLEEFLAPAARASLADGLDTLSCASVHRYKARAVALNLFGGRMQREVINPKSEDEDSEEGGEQT